MGPPPPIRYARSGDVHVAYSVFGDGPDDIVFAWGGISHLELGWEHPPTAWFFEQLGALGRVILFDKRGTGLSDRVPFSSNLDDRMDDVRAVMDAAGSERAYVFGESEAASLCALFAATRPERVHGLVLYAPIVKILQDEDFPWAHPAGAFDRYIETSHRHWGDGLMMSLHSPSTAHDPVDREYWARLERSAMSPGGFVEHQEVIRAVDIRHVLDLVTVPTLVIHRTDDPTVPIGQGRYVAAQVPGAQLVELAGSDHYPMIDDADAVLAAVASFVRHDHVPVRSNVERFLTTVLFTDIVSSTEVLQSIGDRRWHELIERHDHTTATEVERHRGRLIRTTGDGALATFDGPARAIRCAHALKDASQRLGLQIRAGLHSGEVERHGDDVAGIAVHTAARVQGLAAAGELLVSRTVVDLVAGSELRFEDRGEHALRGIEGSWRLFAVSD